MTDWTQFANLGPSADYYWGLFDECAASDSVKVTAYTYNPVEDDQTEYWLGDGTYSGDDVVCYEFNYFPFEFTQRMISGLQYLIGDDVENNYITTNMHDDEEQLIEEDVDEDSL